MPLALGPAGLGAVTATPFAQKFTKQRIDYSGCRLSGTQHRDTDRALRLSGRTVVN